MQKMLDHEMPQRPRRRLIGWWIGLLLLPLAVYGSWKWSNTGTQPNSTPTPTETQQVLAGNAAEHNPAISGNAGTQNTSPCTPTAQATQQAPSVMTNAKGYSGQKNNPDIQAIGQDVTTHEAAQPTEQAHIVQNPAETDVHATAVLSTANLPVQTPDVDMEHRSNPEIPLLKPPPSPPAIKPSRQSPWAVGAITAVSCERFNQINGFSTGINIDRKIAPKWGVRSGLLYNIYTPQEKTKPVASVMPDAFAANIVGRVIILNSSTGQELAGMSNANFYDSLSSNVFIPVNRMQRLEIPLAVFWEPVRVMKVFAGLHLSRTLKTRADRNNYTGNYVLQMADRSAEEAVNKLSSNELNKWQADAALGLGFTASKHLEFGVSGRMALQGASNLARSEKRANALDSGGLELSTRSRAMPILSLYGTILF